MKRLLYIFVSLILLAACQQDELPTGQGDAVLMLDLQRMGRPTMEVTRACDEDLVVDILDADRTLYRHYAAGSVPRKIVLQPGTFIVQAYTDNQTTWATGNDGKGEPCYFQEATVEMEYDMVKRLQMRVPLTNYAVGLQLPDLWDNLFRSYTFRLKSGSRTVVIRQGERAYFDIADSGFSYALSATNTDGRTSSHSAINYTDIESGKCYTIRYSYDSDATTGGVDIVITDDMGTTDSNVNL